MFTIKKTSCRWPRRKRKSYFDADGLEQRDLPGGLSASARKAIEATEVEEARRRGAGGF